MNYIIFTVLSLFVGIYGIYHYRGYESEQRNMGYVEIAAIITGHSLYPLPPKRNFGQFYMACEIPD